MYLIAYKASYSFICTILFGLLVSPKKTLFKDLIPEGIKVKVAENKVFSIFSVTLTLIFSGIISENKVLLGDFEIPIRIVQKNESLALYIVTVKLCQ